MVVYIQHIYQSQFNGNGQESAYGVKLQTHSLRLRQQTSLTQVGVNKL